VLFVEEKCNVMKRLASFGSMEVHFERVF